MTIHLLSAREASALTIVSSFVLKIILHHVVDNFFLENCKNSNTQLETLRCLCIFYASLLK